jgi:hypothetical protein
MHLRPSLLGFLLLILVSPLFADQSGTDFIMSMEQTRINRSVDPRKIMQPDIANQNTAYRPDDGKWFKLPSILVPEEDLNVALSGLGKAPSEVNQILIVEEEGKRYHRLFIHPESENFYQELIKKNISTYSTEFEASATSSSRTLLVRNVQNPELKFFAKLSLDVKLGGVVRTIPKGEVSRSVGISDYILRHEKELCGNFTIMPEVSGIIPKGFDRGGQIIRLIPKEVQENKSYLVPLFSLYAEKDGSTLLKDLALKKGISPTEFVEQHILEPFMEGWAQWAIRGPIVMEAHAQNVLIELDKDMNPTGRFVHRDMGGFNIDMDSKSFNQEDKKFIPYFDSIKEEYHQKFIDPAKRQSLSVYFEGGFLYNIDRELQKIDPHYIKGSIYQTSRKKLVHGLTSLSGASLEELGLTSDPSYEFITNDQSLADVINNAQKKFVKKKVFMVESNPQLNCLLLNLNQLLSK